MTRNRLYLFLFFALVAGYGWLAWALWHESHNDFTPCLIKNATGIACPSCGSTRAVMLLAKGSFADAALTNPLGIVIALILLVFPFWLLYDVAFSKDTLHKSYLQFEKAVKIKWVAALLILLIIANWVWNICKGI